MSEISEDNSNTDPYVRLADTLDKIPNSFTKMEDGTHLKVLQWIFTIEEADLASKMKLMGETKDELVSRLEIEEEEEGIENKLETMAKKGQIRAWDSSTGRRYALIPFVVGIYEEQLKRMDKEFAELAEDYFIRGKGQGLLDTEPPFFKVIPVNSVITPEVVIFPYQQVEKMVNDANSWGLRECICKKQQKLLDNSCKYPENVCVLVSKRENVYDGDENTTIITKEKALEVLKQAEEAGLVHSSMNIQTGHFFICNCCTCCCNVLRNVTENPLAFVNADYYMKVDEDLCTGCETCVDRCQFNALTVNDICEVDLKKCVGCGVCAVTCPEDAMKLVQRDPSEIVEPPEDMMDWMTEKAESRQVDPSDLM